MREEFWSSSKEELQFLVGDRYIGCSKPACQCCQLYFKTHPAEPADPRSPLKIGPNWGPPCLPGEDLDSKFLEQRLVLTKMSVAIRKEAIEQIRRKGPPPVWQNDSTIAFIWRLAQDAPDKLQKHFESLNVGKYTNLSLLRSLLGFLTTDAEDRDLPNLDSSESE